MTTSLKRTARRLAISLVALSALGGCAVYAPPGQYAYYGTDANGQAIYGSPYYGPAYIGPPISLGLGFGYWGGGGGGRGGYHGGRGGYHGGRGGGGHGGGGHR